LGKITALQNGFVKRMVNTSAKVAPKDFDACKAQFIYDAEVLVDYGDTPDALVINWDQLSVYLDNGKVRAKESANNWNR